MDSHNKYFVNLKVKNDNYMPLSILPLTSVTSYLDTVWTWFYSPVIYHCRPSIAGVDPET